VYVWLISPSEQQTQQKKTNATQLKRINSKTLSQNRLYEYYFFVLYLVLYYFKPAMTLFGKGHIVPFGKKILQVLF